MQALKDRIAAEVQILHGSSKSTASDIRSPTAHVCGRGNGEKFRHLTSRILTAGSAASVRADDRLALVCRCLRTTLKRSRCPGRYTRNCAEPPKGTQVNRCGGEFLPAAENVLIVDDFLASGKTLAALARMVRSASANLVGAGVVVEKSFESGREFMKTQQFDIPIESLVVITSMDDGQIVMA